MSLIDSVDYWIDVYEEGVKPNIEKQNETYLNRLGYLCTQFLGNAREIREYRYGLNLCFDAFMIWGQISRGKIPDDSAIREMEVRLRQLRLAIETKER
jgi:hypothetical protein